MLKLLLTAGLILWPLFLTASRTTGENRPAQIYTVESGDSLYTIAKKFNVSVEALKQANALGDKTLLHPGQRLRLPAGAKASTAASPRKKKTVASAQRKKSEPTAKSASLEIYKVRAGDTLSTIAQEQGVPLSELLKANRLEPGALIRVGQALVIPAGSATEQGRKKQKHTTAKKTSRQATGTLGNNKKGRKQKGKSGVHVVQYGDTLFSIARKYHTPLKDLMTLNGIAPTDVIHPGQELKIPGSSYRAKTAKNSGTKQKRRTAAKKTPANNLKPLIYTVKHGDTLWEIAKKHKVSVTQIRRLNKMKKKDVIRSGMKLLIREGNTGEGTKVAKKRTKKPSRTIEKYYTVKKGDTLWEIAKQHKTSVSELRKLNKMARGDIIHTGMKLKVGYEKIPPTRTAKKSTRRTSSKKVATNKSTKTKKKSRVASAGSKKRKSRSRKKADKRINSALAALNGKGSHGSKGGGGGDFNVIRTAKKYLGRRYVWGAEGPSSFDCSGFTQYVMRKSKGVRLPRVSRKQAYYGKYVTRSQLRPGDLVFFDTSRRRRGYVNHVGIYIGNGKFIHASSARHRVVITSLNSPFYRARFKWGRRVN